VPPPWPSPAPLRFAGEGTHSRTAPSTQWVRIASDDAKDRKFLVSSGFNSFAGFASFARVSSSPLRLTACVISFPRDFPPCVTLVLESPRSRFQIRTFHETSIFRLVCRCRAAGWRYVPGSVARESRRDAGAFAGADREEGGAGRREHRD